MKARDLCLMAAGATLSVAVIVLASALVNPPKAQAQAAAAAPGATAITVTANPAPYTLSASTAAGVQVEGGVITINDSANRKVTVVAYSATVGNSYGMSVSPPTITLSTSAAFTY
jgi:hypothetical protein